VCLAPRLYNFYVKQKRAIKAASLLCRSYRIRCMDDTSSLSIVLMLPLLLWEKKL
jgi:hypothetical protein